MTKKELEVIETLERRAAEELEESERLFGKMSAVTISDRTYLKGIRAVLETLTVTTNTVLTEIVIGFLVGILIGYAHGRTSRCEK